MTPQPKPRAGVKRKPQRKTVEALGVGFFGTLYMGHSTHRSALGVHSSKSEAVKDARFNADPDFGYGVTCVIEYAPVRVVWTSAKGRKR